MEPFVLKECIETFCSLNSINWSVQEKKEFWFNFRERIWFAFTSARSDFTKKIRSVGRKLFGETIPEKFMQQTSIMENLFEIVKADDTKLKAWVELVLTAAAAGIYK